MVLALRAAEVAVGRAPKVNRLTLLRRLWSGVPAPKPPGLRFGATTPLRSVVLLDAIPGATAPYRLVRTEVDTLWLRVLRLEQLELVKNQRRHRQLCNASRMLMAYEYAFPGSPIFDAMLGPDPVDPPDCLKERPGWCLALGTTWSHDITAHVADVLGETRKE